MHLLSTTQTVGGTMTDEQRSAVCTAIGLLSAMGYDGTALRLVTLLEASEASAQIDYAALHLTPEQAAKGAV